MIPWPTSEPATAAADPAAACQISSASTVPKVDLYTLEDFLSARECEQAAGADQSSPDSLDGGLRQRRPLLPHQQVVASVASKSPAALGIDEKICRTLGIRPEYSEGIQAQRYDVGQQFKPHWDYFEPGTSEYCASPARAAIAPGPSWCI